MQNIDTQMQNIYPCSDKEHLHKVTSSIFQTSFYCAGPLHALIFLVFKGTQ